MSLKSNFEYIRDWCNFRFLKKTDQVKVDLTNYATKSDLDSAGVWKNKNGVTYLKSDDSSSSSHGYGENSVAEGYSCQANGASSHAEGYDTNASGSYSHAEGYNTQTYNSYEHASGQYNLSFLDNSSVTTFTHGIGDRSNRKNAIAILSNGDIYVYGVGDYNGQYVGNSKSLQSVLEDLSDDPPVKLSNYKDDEEVIAAALNDLNSRIISLKADIDSLLITIVVNGNVGSDGDITSYVNASTTEEQRFLLMNHLDTKIRIIDEERMGFDHMLHYGTYNGYTGYFGFHNGGPVRFYYDSANDKYIAGWHITAS